MVGCCHGAERERVCYGESDKETICVRVCVCVCVCACVCKSVCVCVLSSGQGEHSGV